MYYSALIYYNLSINNAEHHASSETLRAGIYGVGLGALNAKGLKVKPPNFFGKKSLEFHLWVKFNHVFFL